MHIEALIESPAALLTGLRAKRQAEAAYDKRKMREWQPHLKRCQLSREMSFERSLWLTTDSLYEANDSHRPDAPRASVRCK